MSETSRHLPTDRFLFGGDYNPEQWPEEVWAEDVALMQRAGVNVATVGVFSWALLEPTEGVYDLGWLDRVLDTLHAGGISVVLATPTASPPPWFTAAHPDGLPVGPDGTRLSHGSRDTYAISSPAYREACRRIARVLVERYADHPALVAWHVHNEYGSFDWGPHSAAAFRRWLERRYGTLEALNAAWYTAFWSQHYTTWDDILPPVATQYLANPTHAVDFKRFMSDEMLAAFCEQRDIVRERSDAPVTTNFMLPTWNHLEQWSWAAEQDVVSIDHYLDTDGPDGETHAAYGGDLTRSWAGGGPWLLMEQSTVSSTLADRRVYKESDRMIRNSLSYVAHGSQGALFFQWRAPAAGSETWHGGMVPHAGPDSRTFRGFEDLGRSLAAISEVAAPPADGPVVESDVAVLWHADGWWATETKHLPHDGLSYPDAVRGAHRSLWHLGLATDFAQPGTDLSRYRLVLVPSMFAMDDATVDALTSYVEGGGHLVVWPFTGVADEHLHVVAGGYPGRLRELLGVRSEEMHPQGQTDRLTLSDGSTGTLWAEYLTTAGADVTSTYTHVALAGAPATTRHRVGDGEVDYLSTFLEQGSLTAWLDRLTSELGIEPPLGARPPEGVEVVVRRAAAGRYAFVLNHATNPVTITGAGRDLLSGKPTDGGLEIAAGGAAVVALAGTETWSFTV